MRLHEPNEDTQYSVLLISKQRSPIAAIGQCAQPGGSIVILIGAPYTKTAVKITPQGDVMSIAPSHIADINGYIYFSPKTTGQVGKAIKIHTQLLLDFMLSVDLKTASGQAVVNDIESLRASEYIHGKYTSSHGWPSG